MDYSKAYTANWHVYAVKPDTWADGEPLANVDSVEITRTADGDLLESGSMVISEDFANGYYRLVMVAEQDGEVERVEIGTFLFECHSGNFNYGTSTHSAEGHSVLYPASTTRLLAGAYAPAGIDGAEYVKGILEKAISAPIDVRGSFTLNENVVHELGSTVLEAAWAVLMAGNFIMQIDGHGTVIIRPMPDKASLNLNSANAKLMMPGIDYQDDMTDIPNRFTAVNGSQTATVTNDLLDSIVSTVNRGYVHDFIEEDATPCNGETLDSYARRRLRELSLMSDTRTYTREWADDVLPYSLVEASMPNVGLEGNLRVVSQSLTCKYGITVTEQAIKEVQLWQ